MAKPENLLPDAEAFVRQAVSHFPAADIDERSIKAAAVKVSKSFEGIRKQSRVSA